MYGIDDTLVDDRLVKDADRPAWPDDPEDDRRD